jgi:hypothetical protein
MRTHRYDEYIERYEDDDIYQKEIEVHQNFMISNGTLLTKLDTGDTLLMDEEACPSKNTFENQSVFFKDKKEMNDLMHVSRKQILMLKTFDM